MADVALFVDSYLGRSEFIAIMARCLRDALVPDQLVEPDQAIQAEIYWN